MVTNNPCFSPHFSGKTADFTSKRGLFGPKTFPFSPENRETKSQVLFVDSSPFLLCKAATAKPLPQACKHSSVEKKTGRKNNGVFYIL
jgi:hypothetical protein